MPRVSRVSAADQTHPMEKMAPVSSHRPSGKGRGDSLESQNPPSRPNMIVRAFNWLWTSLKSLIFFWRSNPTPPPLLDDKKVALAIASLHSLQHEIESKFSESREAFIQEYKSDYKEKVSFYHPPEIEGDNTSEELLTQTIDKLCSVPNSIEEQLKIDRHKLKRNLPLIQDQNGEGYQRFLRSLNAEKAAQVFVVAAQELEKRSFDKSPEDIHFTISNILAGFINNFSAEGTQESDATVRAIFINFIKNLDEAAIAILREEIPDETTTILPQNDESIEKEPSLSKSHLNIARLISHASLSSVAQEFQDELNDNS